MSKFGKAALAGAISACTSLVTALTDNGVTAVEWATCALAFLVAVGGYYGVSRDTVKEG